MSKIFRVSKGSKIFKVEKEAMEDYEEGECGGKDLASGYCLISGSGWVEEVESRIKPYET